MTDIQQTSAVPAPGGFATRAEREAAEWEAATANAMEVEGYSLYGGKENDRTLDALVGTPFVTRHVTFRPGDIIPQGQKEPRDYVSVEVLIHPSHAHRFPRRTLVFNDGSTGIYRQIVAAVSATGRVDLPEDLPETGSANSTRYDVSLSIPAKGDPSKGGTEAQPTEFDLSIYCPEGLRKSDYPNEFGGGSATTWYLA